MALAGGYDMEKPLLWSKARTGGPRLRQAGVLPMDRRLQGENDIKMGWRKGDMDPWTINGLPPRKQDREKSSEWRKGDSSGFSLAGEPAPNSPTGGLARSGGVGRRSHPSILPFDDGSMLQAQAMQTETRMRERHLDHETALAGGAAPFVEAVPLGTAAEKYAALAKDCDQQGTWREQNYWDNRPYAIDGSHVEPLAPPTDARKRRTDVTKEGKQSFGEYAAGVADRLAEHSADLAVNKSNWRLGDDIPWRIDFSEARLHEHMDSSHQAEWRIGDNRPFCLSGEPPPAVRGYGGELYGEMPPAHRKHTDVAYHQHPQMADARRVAADGYGEHVDPSMPLGQLLNGKATRWGTRADALPEAMDESTSKGLSWAEMRRRGMLQRSASDMVLRPATPSQQPRLNSYGRNYF